MKIISKYKDYYDYLMGIYGEDPLIVLDRREFSMPLLIGEGKLVIYLAGFIVEGYYKDGKVYYGEALKNFGEEVVKSPYWKWWSPRDLGTVRIESKDIHKKYGTANGWNVKLKMEVDEDKTNEKNKCPILILKSVYGTKVEYHMNSILRDLNLGSFLPPEDVYHMLSTWISEQRTKSENFPDNRTNKEKILSKGFDDVTSFRPKIK